MEKDKNIKGFKVSLNKSGFSLEAHAISERSAIKMLKSLITTFTVAVVGSLLIICVLYTVGGEWTAGLVKYVSSIYKLYSRAP